MTHLAALHGNGQAEPLPDTEVPPAVWTSFEPSIRVNRGFASATCDFRSARR